MLVPRHTLAAFALGAGLVAAGPVAAQRGPVPGPAATAPVSPGWLGVILEAPTTGSGAVVDRVVPGSPAAEAGVEPGWHVTGIGGTTVDTVEEMIALVGSHGAGETLTLTLADGRTWDVRLGARPESLDHAARQWVGEPLPDLEVFALDGSGLADVWQPGATTIVEFWATWCGPCRSVAPRVHALDERYGADVRVVAITDEDPADVGDWLDRNSAPGLVAIDPGGEAKDRMWVMALPTWFVVDATGVVRAVVRGADDIADLEAAVVSVAGPPPPAGAAHPIDPSDSH